MRWIEDPRLARQLARATWVVLVAAFVMLTRFPLEPTVERAALGGLLSLVAVLNLPVGLGLAKTRAQSASPAYRAVLLALGFRVIATVAVVAVVSA